MTTSPAQERPAAGDGETAPGSGAPARAEDAPSGATPPSPTPTEAVPTFTEAARRAQIIEAAITTVAELGYHRASLAEIARRAGIAKSAIVYYFGTKDALLLHVVEHVFGELDDALTRADADLAEAAPTEAGTTDTERTDAGPPDPVQRLRTYAGTYLAYVDDHRAPVTAAIDIVVSHRGPDGVPIYLTGTEEDSALLRTVLADGMARGAFRTMPLTVAVAVVEALLDVPTTELQRDRDADLRVLAPEVVDVVLAALTPSAAAG